MRTTSSMRGYTLLEMIVSVGIFSVIMLAATGAYLTLISLDRQARATTDVVTNLSFAVDAMSREIRTGTDYRCNKTGTNCTGTCSTSRSLRFTDAQGRQVDYELSGGQIMARVAGAQSALTDPRISVEKFCFYVRGVGKTGDERTIQPQVTMTIRGNIPTSNGQNVSFTIQGGATQRFIDL